MSTTELLDLDGARLWRVEELDVGTSAADLAKQARLALARDIATKSRAEQHLPPQTPTSW